MKPMEPGDLDAYVELQSPTTTTSSRGARTHTYTTYARVWAGFQPQSMAASEGTMGGKISQQSRILIRMYRRDDVLPNHRIVWDDGRVFQISGVINEFAGNDEMVVAAARVVN